MARIGESDRADLAEFLKDFYGLLDDLILEGPELEGKRALPEEHLPAFRAAWTECKEQCPLDRAQATIRDAPEERLVWAGLYGAQLNLKLAVVDRLRARFLSAPTRRLLKKVLDGIDRILDSILAATGLDEALKEIKDIVSDNIDVDQK